MKRGIITHFSRFRHLEHYRDLIKTENLKYFKEEDHGHKSYNLPSTWQAYLKEKIEEKMDTYKKTNKMVITLHKLFRLLFYQTTLMLISYYVT